MTTKTYQTEFKVLARDNTYNAENDFSHNFTWSIWGPDDTSDWCWNEVYIAICQHYGGDPRNNFYSTPMLFRCESPAESGFLDWVLGWGCSWSRCHDFLDCEPSELDDEKAKEIISEVFDDQNTERLNELSSPGYSQNPTCELDDHLDDGDDCYWYDGRAIVRKDGKWLVCCPYHYHAEIDTPDNGSGWLHDCSISFDSFISEVFDSEDFMTKLDEIYPPFKHDGIVMEHDWDEIEWDNDDDIGQIISCIEFLEFLLGNRG